MSATSADLRDLYRQVVLDHSRNPRNRHRPEHVDRQAEGHNPLCGDKVQVFVQADGEKLEVAFEASGCAICVASASLMTEASSGLPETEVRRLAGQFESSLATGSDGLPGELAALGGVSAYPARIRCATLPWRTLLAALDSAPAPVTTEPTTSAG